MDGFDALRLHFPVFDRGSAYHLVYVCLEEKGAVMNGSGFGHILGRARELAASCENIVTSAELCGDTQGLQAPEDGLEELGKVDRAAVWHDERVLPGSAIRVDGSAAAHTPHDGDAMRVREVPVDFLERVLVFAHHERGRGVPEEEDGLFLQVFSGQVVFQPEGAEAVFWFAFGHQHERFLRTSSSASAAI